MSFGAEDEEEEGEGDESESVYDRRDDSVGNGCAYSQHIRVYFSFFFTH